MKKAGSATLLSKAIKVTLIATIMASSFQAVSQSIEVIERNDRPTPADIIIMNADIRTSDASVPRAQALAIKDGKFIAVGSQHYIKLLQDKHTRVLDAHGNTIIPGIIDAHTHLIVGTDLMDGIDLFGIKDKEQWLSMVKEKAASLPKGSWIFGGRWDASQTADKTLPTAADLDKVSPDHPVALIDVDYHTMWVNSKALQELDINDQTKNPTGGTIQRDSNGKATGILQENAIDIYNNSPKVIAAQGNKSDKLRKIIHHFNSLGVTGVHDMWTNVGSEYIDMLKKDGYPMRVWYGYMVDTNEKKSGEEAFKKQAELQKQMNNFAKLREKDIGKGPMYRYGYHKYYMDGTLLNRTAALHEPYADTHDHFLGKPLFTQRRMDELVQLSHKYGFPVAIHAIGDNAVSMALQSFKDSPDGNDKINRIEHIELSKFSDMEKFAQQGVIPSMQPDHAISGNFQEERLGKARLQRGWAWQSLLTAGGHLVFGSDWPTAKEDPMLQLGDATLREKDGRTWHGENALSFDEALYAYTQAPAKISGWDKEIGSITVGKWADFAIVDGKIKDPIPQDIRSWKISQTWFAGEKVYDKEQPNDKL
ncbi:amidohydrolase [Yokenella regensburgei]|jgi:hypothetical protein|uniref:amidohydrolase n=1 Tax=Yokenella regensburgei TaxID=158877 RepID=UPI001432B6B0|nr:amidohydrolase [Yokenella regensburgei]MDQ4431036.1 amidohydrolase [Yokenella regensburgei]QIU91894.1 amidohydrolase [Yokenella regensburgei]